MFWSYTLKDVVEVEPVYFPVESTTPSSCSGSPTACSSTSSTTPLASWSDLILHRLTERYVGKVVPRLGFCVAVEHILEYTPCEVKGPNGSAWLTAIFDVCVFAPTPGTRFRAKIAHQEESGLYLRMDFFASYRVFVPADQLLEGSVFDVASGRWALPVESEEGVEDDQAVASESGSIPPLCNHYISEEDVIAKVVQCVVFDGDRRKASATTTTPELMYITASFRGDCLGPVAWFEDEDEEAL